LSEKWAPKTLNLVEIGMSKKKGTKDANIKPYGPGVKDMPDSNLVSLNAANATTSKMVVKAVENKRKTKYLFDPICRSKTRKKYTKYNPNKSSGVDENTHGDVTKRHNSSFCTTF
jgi:hypothetical protein